MTEVEWLECADPDEMLAFLRGKGSDRQVRLFAVACCYRIRSLFPHGDALDAVQIAEQYADGVASDIDRLKAKWVARKQWAKVSASIAFVQYPLWMAKAATIRRPWEIVEFNSAAEVSARATDQGHMAEAQALLELHQAEPSLIRDVFGNPFHFVNIADSCLTPPVVTLAQTIYNQRSFERMPELADALEMAGCYDVEVLRHCRAPGPHVPGCWALDLILGKE